jgi:hypothetical protein
MLSYRTILKQAWKISWKNKFLWFFGLFASLISFTVEFKVISRALNQESGLRSLNEIMMFLGTGVFSRNAWENIKELFTTDPGSLIILTLVLLIIIALTVFFAWLSTVSQIGIIKSVDNILKEKKVKLNIKNGIKAGNKKFWPVFGLNLIITAVINIIFLLISLLLVLVVIKDQTFMTILYGIIFITMIPVTLFLSFIIKYAIAFSVIENKKFCESIKRGWKLFFENWIISIEVAVILFFINFIAMIALSVASFIILFIFIGLAASLVFITSYGLFFWLIVVLGALIIVALTLIVSAILNVFQISSWTDLFVHLRSKGGISKIEKIFAKK